MTSRRPWPWAGAKADGLPHPEPVFVVGAPAALPRFHGKNTTGITGRVGGGQEFFSISFGMPEDGHGDESSGFAFILSVRSGWEACLASITLTGPGRPATPDGESDLAMANPARLEHRTGAGLPRGPPPSGKPAMDAAGQRGGPGTTTPFSAPDFPWKVV